MRKNVIVKKLTLTTFISNPAKNVNILDIIKNKNKYSVREDELMLSGRHTTIEKIETIETSLQSTNYNKLIFVIADPDCKVYQRFKKVLE